MWGRLLTCAAVGYRRFRCQHGSWPIAKRPQIHNPLHKGCASGDYLVVTVASPARRPSPVAVIFTRPALPRSPRTFNGLALLIVRGERGKAGRVKITATGEGLRAGEATVTTR